MMKGAHVAVVGDEHEGIVGVQRFQETPDLLVEVTIGLDHQVVFRRVLDTPVVGVGQNIDRWKPQQEQIGVVNKNAGEADAGDDGGSDQNPPPEPDEPDEPPPASQQDQMYRLLDKLEEAPTYQEQEAKKRVLHRRQVMEDK